MRSDNVFANESSGRFATQGQFRYNENTNGIWDNSYGVISLANIIIETDVSTLKGDQDHGKHLQGGAYFLRALAHYDLIRFSSNLKGLKMHAIHPNHMMFVSI